MGFYGEMTDYKPPLPSSDRPTNSLLPGTGSEQGISQAPNRVPLLFMPQFMRFPLYVPRTI
jgi:hypothetical protein